MNRRPCKLLAGGGTVQRRAGWRSFSKVRGLTLLPIVALIRPRHLRDCGTYRPQSSCRVLQGGGTQSATVWRVVSTERQKHCRAALDAGLDLISDLMASAIRTGRCSAQ
jgi:hypothetical protein